MTDSVNNVTDSLNNVTDSADNITDSVDKVTESKSTGAEVQVGDVLRSRDGTEFTVSRIEPFGMFGPPLLAFIEDSDVKWFKMPCAPDGEVTLVQRP